MEKKEKVFSLHRYIDGSGIPDFERIFSKGESRFWHLRHLDPGLKKIWRNQPDVVQKVVERHLSKCEECHDKSEELKKEPGEVGLELSSS